MPPRSTGTVPTVIALALTHTPPAFAIKPAFATNAILGFPETPSPFVILIPFELVIVLASPVPTPVRTTIPFVEMLYTVFALLAVPV